MNYKDQCEDIQDGPKCDYLETEQKKIKNFKVHNETKHIFGTIYLIQFIYQFIHIYLYVYIYIFVYIYIYIFVIQISQWLDIQDIMYWINK